MWNWVTAKRTCEKFLCLRSSESPAASVTRVSQERPFLLKVLLNDCETVFGFLFFSVPATRNVRKHRWQQEYSCSRRLTSRIFTSLLDQLATYYLLCKLVFCFDQASFLPAYAVSTLFAPSKTLEYWQTNTFMRLLCFILCEKLLLLHELDRERCVKMKDFQKNEVCSWKPHRWLIIMCTVICGNIPTEVYRLIPLVRKFK